MWLSFWYLWSWSSQSEKSWKPWIFRSYNKIIWFWNLYGLFLDLIQVNSITNDSNVLVEVINTSLWKYNLIITDIISYTTYYSSLMCITFNDILFWWMSWVIQILNQVFQVFTGRSILNWIFYDKLIIKRNINNQIYAQNNYH